MHTKKRILLSAVAMTTAFGLTACNSDGETKSEGSSTTQSSSAAPSSDTSSSTGGSESSTTESAPATSSSSDSGGDTTEDPASGREDKNDKSALDAEYSKIPSGPLTGAKIVMLGGYGDKGSEYGDFYAVLRVNASGPGLVNLEYVMLDASGKELGVVKGGFEVGKGDNVIKVTNAVGKVPAGVKKVRLRVTKNDSNQFATVTEIDPDIRRTMDSSTNSPIISGRYRTVGKSSVTSLNAICSDAAGLVQTASSPVPKINAPEWTKYEVKFLSSPAGYKPTRCYVGS